MSQLDAFFLLEVSEWPSRVGAAIHGRCFVQLLLQSQRAPH